jgi:hypothetical protein
MRANACAQGGGEAHAQWCVLHVFSRDATRRAVYLRTHVCVLSNACCVYAASARAHARERERERARARERELSGINDQHTMFADKPIDKRDLMPNEAACGTAATSSVDMLLATLVQAHAIADFFPLHQMESRR